MCYAALIDIDVAIHQHQVNRVALVIEDAPALVAHTQTGFLSVERHMNPRLKERTIADLNARETLLSQLMIAKIPWQIPCCCRSCRGSTLWPDVRAGRFKGRCLRLGYSFEFDWLLKLELHAEDQGINRQVSLDMF